MAYPEYSFIRLIKGLISVRLSPKVARSLNAPSYLLLKKSSLILLFFSSIQSWPNEGGICYSFEDVWITPINVHFTKPINNDWVKYGRFNRNIIG